MTLRNKNSTPNKIEVTSGTKVLNENRNHNNISIAKETPLLGKRPI